MANLPSATVTLSESGGGVGAGSDVLCVMSCSQSGTVASPRLHAKVADTASTFGFGEMREFHGHYAELVRKPLLLIRLTSATAGSIGPVDTTHVAGTSVISFSGAPYDREALKLVVVTGGTIGTAGIEIKVSRDGGRTYGRTIRLGTATSYVIPDTGVTAAFAAGTLVADDYATAQCVPPAFDATGLAAGFDALAAQSILPRLILLTGEVLDDDALQAVIDEVEAFETQHGRHCRVIVQLRRRYPDVAMQGDPSDVDFDGTAHTITRATGSFITDGFKVGMVPTVSGSVSNNGVKAAITNVTATVLTLASGLTTEANVATAQITASESASTWRASLAADIVGNSEATLKVSHRVLARAGTPRRKSPLDGHRKQRPFAWAEACRLMAHDIHISPSKVELGGLEGWTITDEDGILETHDERVDSGLLAIRVGCPTTVDGIPGVFSALPLTLDEDDAPLSRAPIGFVGDLLCQVAKRETTRKLGSEVVLNADGTITKRDKARIEAYVLARLKAAVLSPRAEGPRASAVSFSMDGTVDLREPGAQVPCEVLYTPLGYLEQIATTVRVSRAGS